MLRLALSLLLGLTSSSTALAAAPDVAADLLASLDGRLHYSAETSFRGLENGRVKNYDLAGHGQALAGVHDFLRLVPPTPLAHGSLFSVPLLTSQEWIVELAFRVHGPETSGLAEGVDEKGQMRKSGGMMKGGRGLAFWVTKEGLPLPATVTSSSGKISSPPPISPTPHDPTDPLVSLFGSRVSFDGLGILFDSSPSSPLFRRSDPRNLADHHEAHEGRIGATGVVSGILDDGKGGWLDREGRVMKGSEEEAGYLERAVGECEAAFRNAQGLLWARVAFVNSTIRVDLDLSPHTTLSKAGRHYEHNCFTLPGVTLSSGMHLGLSGLASGSTEPDSVDVYALDVFEVLPLPSDPSKPIEKVDSEEPPEPAKEEVLEGTTDEGIPTLTHEIFLSQARMVEAIDALARKIDSLGNVVSGLARGGLGGGVGASQAAPVRTGGAEGNVPDSRLASLDSQLTDLVAMVSSLRTEEAARAHEGKSLTHLVQLQERLMEEVKAVGRRVEGATGQHSASLSTLASRSSEQLQLLKSTSSYIDAQLSSSGLFSGLVGKALFALVGVVVGIVFAAWREKSKRDDPWGSGGKKYF
ncbi:hypothetical protein JCM8547_000674 [Rhodosporidiobolus lusitaniae]